MVLKITEEPIRRKCSDELIEILKSVGISTSGEHDDLKSIIISNGFGLPSVYDDNYFGFVLEWKWVRLCFNYCDCMAEEVLLLKKLNLIK
jgi:hypothetical protein